MSKKPNTDGPRGKPTTKHCPHCGSVLSCVTFTCVRGVHCPGPKRPK